MSEAPAKHRKLTDLRQAVPHVSKSSLESILKYVDKHGLPERLDAKAMRDANRALLADADAYGPLLVHQDVVCMDGSTLKVQFVNLCSFLHFAYKQGGSWYNCMKTLLESNAGPLGLCLYSDEVCPGNPLAANPSRKCWVVYAGFKEMGPLLCNENAWITLCIVRSSIVAEIEAGMSQLIKKILFLIFLNPWCEVQHLGIALQPPRDRTGEQSKRFRMDLRLFVQDGQAQKMTWSVRGDSGSRFCCLCSNCFTSKDSQEEEDEAVSSACQFTRHAELVQHSSEEMLASWDRMAARKDTCTALEWKQWQQAAGVTYSPEALLACSDLRHILQPTKQWMHDYMHALLSNGLLSYGTFYLLQELDCWTTFFEYTKFWQLPKQFCSVSISKLFESKRVAKHKKSDKLNCTASELLSVLPVLAHFLKKVCRDQSAGIQAWLAMAALLEVIHSGFSGKVTPNMVFRLAEDALGKWKDAGWPFRKKNHWVLHFYKSFQEHDFLISCFSMERKHKMITRKTSLLHNTTVFETSAMEEVATGELQTLARDGMLDADMKLLQSKKPGPKDKEFIMKLWPSASASVLASTSARCQDGTVSVGDVALFCDPRAKWACGRIKNHFQHGAETKTVLEYFSLLEQHDHYAVWKPGAGDVAVPLQQIFTAVTYAKDAGKILTLVPWRWR